MKLPIVEWGSVSSPASSKTLRQNVLVKEAKLNVFLIKTATTAAGFHCSHFLVGSRLKRKPIGPNPSLLHRGLHTALERRTRKNHLTLFSKVEIPRKKQRPSARFAKRGLTFNVHNKPNPSLSRALSALGTPRTAFLPAEITPAACSVFPCHRYGGSGP